MAGKHQPDVSWHESIKRTCAEYAPLIKHAQISLYTGIDMEQTYGMP